MSADPSRSIDDGPWCWQSKPGLRKIQAACDSRTDKAYVLAVYLVLTQEASDRQSEEFKLEISHIAARAGASYRKTKDILKFLGALGMIVSRQNHIEGTKELGPCTYTLCTVCPTLGTECSRLGTDAEQTSLPRGKKNPQNNHKEKGENSLPEWPLALAEPILASIAEAHGSSSAVVAAAWPRYRGRKVRYGDSFEKEGFDGFQDWLRDREGKTALRECSAEIRFAAAQSQSAQVEEQEPAGWRAWVTEHYPGALCINPESQFFAKTWSEVPADYRALFSQGMGESLRSA